MPLRMSIGSDSDRSSSHSAIENYFNDFVPRLGFTATDDFDDQLDDPTIDLSCLGKNVALRASTPIQTRCVNKESHDFTSNNSTKELSLVELQFLTDVFKQKNPYSEKLTDIMLDDLKNSLGVGFEPYIMQGKLPGTFFPRVKFNSDNKPYVDFIIKSDSSDEPPFDQECSLDHLGYSKFILEHLVATAQRLKSNSKPKQIMARFQEKPQQLSRLQHPHPHHHQQQQLPRLKRKKATTTTDLNNSRRVLPSRSCKHLNGSYRV